MKVLSFATFLSALLLADGASIRRRLGSWTPADCGDGNCKQGENCDAGDAKCCQSDCACPDSCDGNPTTSPPTPAATIPPLVSVSSPVNCPDCTCPDGDACTIDSDCDEVTTTTDPATCTKGGTTNLFACIDSNSCKNQFGRGGWTCNPESTTTVTTPASLGDCAAPLPAVDMCMDSAAEGTDCLCGTCDAGGSCKLKSDSTSAKPRSLLLAVPCGYDYLDVDVGNCPRQNITRGADGYFNITDPGEESCWVNAIQPRIVFNDYGSPPFNKTTPGCFCQTNGKFEIHTSCAFPLYVGQTFGPQGDMILMGACQSIGDGPIECGYLTDEPNPYVCN